MSRAFGSASARSSGKASFSSSATSRTMSSARGISIALPLRPRPDRASTRMTHFRRTLNLKQRIAATMGCRREYPYEPVHTVAADQPVQTWPTVDAVASGALRKYHLARPSKRTASVNARDFAQRCLSRNASDGRRKYLRFSGLVARWFPLSQLCSDHRAGWFSCSNQPTRSMLRQRQWVRCAIARRPARTARRREWAP